MEPWNLLVHKFIALLGFSDYTVEVDEAHRHGSVFIHDHPALIKEHLPLLVESMNHLVQLIAHKRNEAALFIDINNYRHERENLIVELVRASARKALATKQEISLPAMNSYERRLAHVELAANPYILTESVGTGRGRYVVIKPILENISSSAPVVRDAVASIASDQLPIESA